MITTFKFMKHGPWGPCLEKYEKEGKDGKVVHNVICDQCNKRIEGIRFKCSVCPDFDFCEACEKEFGEKHGHAMIKITKPNNFGC